MPFRSKLKRALGGGGNSSNSPSDTSSLNKTTSSKSSKLPDNVYKPGEPMPRPKYRGPWNQAHQDKLSAFRFGSFSSNNSGGGGRKGKKIGPGMLRRKSSGEASARAGSEYSPMGSKLPSRGPSRRGSAWSGFTGGGGRGGMGMGSRRQTQEREREQRDGGLVEVEGDGGDVGNVGLSRQHTAEGKPQPQQQQQPHQQTTFQTQPPANGNPDAGTNTDNELQPSKTITLPQTNGHHPDGAAAGTTLQDLETQRTITNHGAAGPSFTADELAVAMSRNTIQGEGQRVGR